LKKKILYVDDEQINCQMFTFNFRRQFEVFTALSGFEGLDLLEKETDIVAIVSDWKMPKMNGMEFIEIAKSKRPELKTYILSGFDSNSEIKKSIEDQIVNGFFQKPMDISEIKETLSKALEQ